MPPVTSNYQLRRQINTPLGKATMAKGSKVAGTGKSTQAPTFKYQMKNGVVQTYKPTTTASKTGGSASFTSGPKNTANKGGKSAGNKSVAGRGSVKTGLPGTK